jgi:hypothetical protein
MTGFYRMDYAGPADQGAGAIAFTNNKIAGLDVAGGIYVGSYTLHEGRLVGELNVTFPQGGTLVTGAVVPPGANILVQLDLAHGLLDGHHLQVQVLGQSVSARLSKVADL